MSFLFAQGPYTLSFDLSQFQFSIENGYDRVRGIKMSTTTDTGAPELPLKSLNFIIPNGYRVQNIEVISLTLIPLDGTYNIYPVQPEIPLGINDSLPLWVPPDTAIYSQDALYPDSIPVEILHQGHYDGQPIVALAIYPLLYNPVRDSLYLVQAITFGFQFQSVPLSVRPQIRGERIHQLYLKGLKTTVFNNWEVDGFYLSPGQIVSDDELGRLGYPEVIIIAPPACTLAYRPVADWLTEKGMFCFIRSTDWVYANFDGIWPDLPGYPGENTGDDAAKIKEYLRTLYLTNGTAFAILGGSAQFNYPDNYFPFRYSVAYAGGIPNDLYFQDFTGSWPNDPDYQGEIWVGRVPAWNYDQALSWVEKRLIYEKSPTNRDLMTHSLWLTQNPQPPDWINFPAWMDSAKQYFPSNIIQHQVVNHPCNAGDHRLIDTLSIGYGMLTTYGHGAPDNQRVAYPDLRQLLFSWPFNYGGGPMPNLKEPTNVNKYYLVYSIGCDNAWYDTSKALDGGWTGWTANGPLPCMAEAFTSFYRLDVPPDKRPAINAVAFLGNTRWGLCGSSMFLHQNFINRLFYNDTLIGVAEARARYSDPKGWQGWYVTYSHNLFGSPEMPVWTENPRDMIVEHPGTIPVNVPLNFVVTARELTHQPDPNPPLQNALVTLYKPGPTLPEVYESQLTDAEGNAYFTLNVPTPGIMKVTVTKHNYLPYQGDVQVFEYEVDIQTGHTQYSEARKLVHQPNTENLNLVYTYGVGGADIPQEWSTFSFSTDGGVQWSEGQNVLPEVYNHNPSIDLTSDNRPCVAFRKSVGWLTDQSAVIYFARYDEPDWSVYTVDSYPAQPPSFYPRVSPPAMLIDANNICHLVYSGVLYAPGKAYVVYKRFDVYNPGTETVIIDSADVPEDWQPLSPSIGLQLGYPHIVYDFPPEAGEPVSEIWYKCLTETGWTDPINISCSYNNPSLHPFILLTNEKVIVVWSEEEVPGDIESREIYRAERFLNQPPGSWEKWKEIETENQASDWAVITANGRTLVWCEHQLIDGEKNWEVLYHSNLYGDGNLSNSPYTQSRYPSCDWRQTQTGIYLYSAFTEKYESEDNPEIFGIKIQRKRLPYIPIPLYTIYAGAVTPSPYLLQRDGYIAYENYPVDYDTNELVYKFTNLNPGLKYRLNIV